MFKSNSGSSGNSNRYCVKFSILVFERKLRFNPLLLLY